MSNLHEDIEFRDLVKLNIRKILYFDKNRLVLLGRNLEKHRKKNAKYKAFVTTNCFGKNKKVGSVRNLKITNISLHDYIAYLIVVATPKVLHVVQFYGIIPKDHSRYVTFVIFKKHCQLGKPINFTIKIAPITMEEIIDNSFDQIKFWKSIEKDRTSNYKLAELCAIMLTMERHGNRISVFFNNLRKKISRPSKEKVNSQNLELFEVKSDCLSNDESDTECSCDRFDLLISRLEMIHLGYNI
ncbi:hypothetical protein SNEBB_011277 [Seison nebaliae]|nr:hypothetical protein SNEBB_011277 [Seison nebaliae]